MASQIFKLGGERRSTLNLIAVSHFVNKAYPTAFKQEMVGPRYFYTRFPNNRASEPVEIVAEAWMKDDRVGWWFVIKKEETERVGDVVITLQGGLIDTVWVKGMPIPNIEVIHDIFSKDDYTDEGYRGHLVDLKRVREVKEDPEFKEVY